MLTNYGTVAHGNISGQSIQGRTNTAIYNFGRWQAIATYNSIDNSDGLTNKLFLNAGTFQKVGTSTSMGWPWTNTGTLELKNGTLAFGDTAIRNCWRFSSTEEMPPLVSPLDSKVEFCPAPTPSPA